MTIMPGAGAYWFEGNEVGCLILHGFTGTPQNVRPLADYLARRGLAVSVPRIAGHGTTRAGPGHHWSRGLAQHGRAGAR